MKKHLYSTLIACCSVVFVTAQPNCLDSYVGATVTPTVIASGANQVNQPKDLDFKPHSNELWVVNYGTGNGGSMVIIYNAGQPNQTSQYRKDTHSSHFMVFPSAIAFGDDGFWAGVSEIQSTNGGTSTFMGPALWSSDTAIFAKVFQNNWLNGFPLGSHYDMLHQSPFSMGIAHDSAMAYWVNDGHFGTICLYDYVQHHGPGYDNHSAGKIWRYTDVNVTRVAGIPSHMILDKTGGWLYFVDGGPKKIKRMDVNSGTITGNLSVPSTSLEPLAGYKGVAGATVHTLDSLTTQPCGIDFFNDRLIVSDYTTGDIYLYSTSGTFTLLDTIVTGIPGMMGVKVGPDGRIWCVNRSNNNVYRLDIASPGLDAALIAITEPDVQNFMPGFYATGFNICNGSISPSVTLENKGTTAITSADIQYTLNNGSPVVFAWTGTLTSGSAISVALPSIAITPGAHLLSISVVSVNGIMDDVSLNNTVDGSFRAVAPPVALPFTEDFSAVTFPPAGWNYIQYNPNNKMSRSTAGGFGLSTGSLKMDNYSGDVDISGQKDYLVSPILDLSSATVYSWLRFNVAHARYNTSSNDALRVLVSTDCGNTWSTEYSKSGSVLATAPNSSSAWTPSAAQWRTDSVNLSAYAGQSEVLLALMTESDFGNNVYVDDLLVVDLVTGIKEVSLNEGISLYPNPVSSLLQISFKEKASEEMSGSVFSLDGRLIKTFVFPARESRVELDFSDLSSGVYTVRLIGNESVFVGSVVVR